MEASEVVLIVPSRILLLYFYIQRATLSFHTHTSTHTHTLCTHIIFQAQPTNHTKKTITFQNSPQICQMYFLNLWFSFPWRRNSEPYSCFAFASTPRRWCGAFPDSLPVITPQVHLLPWANSYIISPFPPYNQKKNTNYFCCQTLGNKEWAHTTIFI